MSWILSFFCCLYVLFSLGYGNDLSELTPSAIEETYATGLSEDGSVVVGYFTSSKSPYFWTKSGGYKEILLPAGYVLNPSTTPGSLKASSDGSVLVLQAINGVSLRKAFKVSISGATMVVLDIGTLGGSTVSANMSDNGTVIVGTSNSNAFRYDGVMTSLHPITGGWTSSTAQALSGDGLVISGTVTQGSVRKAFVYAGPYAIGVLNSIPGDSLSEVTGMSRDGKTIVGFSGNDANNRNHGVKFVWDGTTWNPHDLGFLPAGVTPRNTTRHIPNLVSQDGSVITGIATDGGNGLPIKFSWPFYYSDDKGMVLIGTPENIGFANAMSNDGSVIVGNAVNPLGVGKAFQCTDPANLIDLGTFGGEASSATGVSGDGTVIVGWAEDAIGMRRAFIYNTKSSSSNLIDVENTKASMILLGNTGAGLLDLRAAQVSILMDRSSLGRGDLSIGVSPRYFSTGGLGLFDMRCDVSSSLTSKVTLDLSLGCHSFQRMPASYVNSENVFPGIGGGIQFKQSRDGLRLSGYLCGSYACSDAIITREKLSNTEAGKGKARLEGQAFNLGASYGIKISQHRLFPFIGLRSIKVTRAAYIETSGATFPAKYGSLGYSSQSLYGGCDWFQPLNRKHSLNLTLQAGGIWDMHVNERPYTADMEYLGSYEFSTGLASRLRCNLGAGFVCKLNRVKLAPEVFWQRQKYNQSVAGGKVLLSVRL